MLIQLIQRLGGDDHEIVRRGVRELIDGEDDLVVVGEAGTGAEAIARLPSTRPDVAILDVQLPDGSAPSKTKTGAYATGADVLEDLAASGWRPGKGFIAPPAQPDRNFARP